MAFNEEKAQRIRDVLASESVVERKMFGGLTFMVNGHMCCGLDDTGLMVRVGPDAYQRALAMNGARQFDVTGKALGGMVYVEFDSVKTKRVLKKWVQRGVSFVSSLPPKKKTEKKVGRKRRVATKGR